MPLINLENVSEGPTLLPNGEYSFITTEAQLKTTRDGTGEFIACTFECTTPGFEKRRVWTRFNVKNKNPQAVSISLGQLKTMLKAAGQKGDELYSVDALLGLKFRAEIASDHRPPYDAQNIVKKYVIEKMF